MANSSLGWSSARISSIASRLFFLLIILQIPLFRVSCRSGSCKTPMHVTFSQLVGSDIVPVAAVKALLFPGAIAHGLVQNMTVPSWGGLLDMYNLTSVKDAPVVNDLKRLELDRPFLKRQMEYDLEEQGPDDLKKKKRPLRPDI